MQYFGGKQRIAPQLVEFLQPIVDQATAYTEPFVGSANVMHRIRHPRRYGHDANRYLITMWQGLQNGWEPPGSVTEADYQAVKATKPDHPITAFVAFGCSFAGKWFGGYARNSVGHNYAHSARNSLLRKLPGLDGVAYSTGDYRLAPYFEGGVVYCDPPYRGTTQYGAVGDFDSDRFWSDMRDLARLGAQVYVSEYSAPSGVPCVWETETKTDIRDATGSGARRVERLFHVTP
jgi:DNA adenine methylase